MNMKILSQLISKSGQKVNLTTVMDASGHKVRVRICSDSHAPQSFAIAERWNGEQWHEVATIPDGAMKTKGGLCYLPATKWDDASHFEEDFCWLRQEVEHVLA